MANNLQLKHSLPDKLNDTNSDILELLTRPSLQWIFSEVLVGMTFS